MGRLVAIHIDQESIRAGSRDVQVEREQAIMDVILENNFTLIGDPEAKNSPEYELNLSLVENRLQFLINRPDGQHVGTHILSLSPFRKIIKDYFLVCESYYEAIKLSASAKIEAIDMGRRGLHNEGTQLLLDRLNGKIDIDFETGRRMFTLICALHWKG